MMPSAKSTVPSIDRRRIWFFRSLFIWHHQHCPALSGRGEPDSSARISPRSVTDLLATLHLSQNGFVFLGPAAEVIAKAVSFAMIPSCMRPSLVVMM
jgi:hypothetical protein